MKISQETYIWYLIVGLTIAVFAIKFFVGLNSSKNSNDIPAEYKSVALPIKKEFNKAIIEELQKKKIINANSLQSLKPYSSIIRINSDNIKDIKKLTATPSATPQTP